MTRKIATTLYWTVGILIGLGAFGHGFLGVRPIRAAIATSTLPPDVRQVIWIVWYCTSAAMLAFGTLVIWAWFAARDGMRQALTVPLIIGTLWVAEGVGSYAYQHNGFWLLFVVEGTVLVAATVTLRATRSAAT
jgi:hypothetical protein